MRPCEPDPPVAPDPPLSQGYNSHGSWSTLAGIREVERDRGNAFSDLPGCPGDTPAIWVTRTPREALRYSVDASEWDRIGAGGPLRPSEREEMLAIAERPIKLLPDDIVAAEDGDGGYLLLRPGEGNIGGDAVSPARMDGCITTGRRAGFCRPAGPTGGPGDGPRLLDEFLFFSVGIDGIITDRKTATDPAVPCKCVDIEEGDGRTKPFCFKKGVIGTLDQQQVSDLCAIRAPLQHPEGIRRRLAEFGRASSACRGMPIETRLECMSEALRKDGVRWGLDGR